MSHSQSLRHGSLYLHVVSVSPQYFVCYAGVCPVGWQMFNGHCYQFNDREKHSWDGAMMFCEDQGATLFEPDTPNRAKFLKFVANYLGREAINAMWLGFRSKSCLIFAGWYFSQIFFFWSALCPFLFFQVWMVKILGWLAVFQWIWKSHTLTGYRRAKPDVVFSSQVRCTGSRGFSPNGPVLYLHQPTDVCIMRTALVSVWFKCLWSQHPLHGGQKITRIFLPLIVISGQ